MFMHKTSKLQLSVGELLEAILSSYNILENSYPDWLYSYRFSRHLELDFYIPQLYVAFEVQGIQHDKLIPYFQDSQGFSDQQHRDREKIHACEAVGVKLFRVYNLTEAGKAIGEIVRDIIPISSDTNWIIEKEKQMYIHKRIMAAYLKYKYFEDCFLGKKDYYCNDCNHIGPLDDLENHVCQYHRSDLSLIKKIGYGNKEQYKKHTETFFADFQKEERLANLCYYVWFRVAKKNSKDSTVKEGDKHFRENGLMPPISHSKNNFDTP